MLVIYVITAVIGFVIYTVIKIKIEEWFEECRMSRLSLKKHDMSSQGSPCKNESVPSSEIIHEISSDESNGSNICDSEMSDQESAVNKVYDSELSDEESAINEVYDNETLHNFQKSTDSVTSDEDVVETVFPSTSRGRTQTSLFGWPKKNINLKKDATMEHKMYDFSDDESNIFVPTLKNNTSKKIDLTMDDDSNSSSDCKQKKKFKGLGSAEPSNTTEPKEDVSPGVNHEIMISGIKVKLPVKPYSSQLAVMSKLIQGCVKKENCLLESPTGSGKTLALLCGVLAWHDHHVAQVRKELDAMRNDDCDMDTYDDEEFGFRDKFLKAATSDDTKIPKIYYGTRTHKQIEQVIRELKKTCYTHKKMTILSSREHTCIQESTKNKTELCNDLLDPAKHKGCPFYNEGNKKTLGSFRAVKAHGLEPAWDIEDLVTIGKDIGVCPYFSARSLMEEADIIFCPYNYIVDPDIRETMQLDLTGQVIIVDEAHNIEDICRDVASVSFRDDHLTAAAHECEVLVNQRTYDGDTYTTLKEYLLRLVKFLKDMILHTMNNAMNIEMSSPYYTGRELLEYLNMHNLGESVYPSIVAAGKAAITDCNKAKEDSRMVGRQSSVKPTICATTKLILQHLLFTLEVLTSKDFVDEFRACVIETVVTDYQTVQDDTWHSVKKQSHRARTLKLFCMNPGVTFTPLAKAARCVVLASGTLTPIGSFESELNTRFVHVLNTAHVIPKEQIFATCIPKGPTGIALRATFQNVNQWDFQEELGRVLIDICETVPHGILCFFSSYKMMNTQVDRWKTNQTWNRISRRKQVFMEPRFGSDLNVIMQVYREVIQETSSGPKGNVDGALLLAVFRGKVAEGIDFKDNEARCVVTVGIPYPVRKDPVIDMKFQYNDINSKKGLLRGTEWYSIQAYRALNQALGRCLRHINDWGAVLLVDERFLMEEYKDNLSKWVKTMFTRHVSYNLRTQLCDFVARQKARERELEKSETA